MQTTVKCLSLGWISVNNHHSTYKKVLFIYFFYEVSHQTVFAVSRI